MFFRHFAAVMEGKAAALCLIEIIIIIIVIVIIFSVYSFYCIKFSYISVSTLDISNYFVFPKVKIRYSYHFCSGIIHWHLEV